MPEIFDDLVVSKTVLEALPSSDAVKYKEVIFDRLIDIRFPSDPDAIWLQWKGKKSIHDVFLELPDSPPLRTCAKRYFEVFAPSLLYASLPLIPDKGHLETLRRLALRRKDVVSKAAEMHALCQERAVQTPIMRYDGYWIRDDWFELLKGFLDLRFYDVRTIEFF